MSNKDDERLRKTTIAFLKDFAKQGYENAVECIDWLEKQSEKPQGKSALEAAKEEKVDNQNCVKPTDKVEPKFREGDWVVQGYNILKIKCVGDTHYCFETVGGYTDDILISEVDSQYHLWTIDDAKDGDVLSYRDGQWIYIYKEKIDDSSFDYHILYSTIHQDLTIDDSGFTLLSDAIIPATKEQRDTLMKAMADKGYTFDFEKKELKKIEQKPTEDGVEPKYIKRGERKSNPYSGTSFEYNGHTWGMCARDGGVEILVDGHVKSRVFTNDNNAKEMFVKALERVEEENAKGYKLTDCDKNSWWEDFKAYVSCAIEQKSIDDLTPQEAMDIAVAKCFEQGEQKPADNIESSAFKDKLLELFQKFRYIKEGVPTNGDIIEYVDAHIQELINTIQNNAWSEEDERSIRDSIFYLKSAKKYFEKDDDILWDEKWFNLCIEWLESLYKKLRLQSQWKPSEEQMEVLLSEVTSWTKGCPKQIVLESLYNDLKKLRDE